MRKRIVIVAQRKGVVPALDGGAVESLLESIINENEKKHNLDIVLIEPYDDRLVGIKNQYKYTKFIFIKEPLWKKIIAGVIYKLRNIIDIKRKMIHPYIVGAYEKIKKLDDFDWLIIEEGEQIEGYTKLAHEYKGKVIYHSHLHEIPEYGTEYDRVIAVSEFCKNEWTRCLPVNDLSVVYNGIAQERFLKKISLEERIEIRGKLGIDKNDFIVLYCGRIIEVKGVKELVESIIKINDPKVKLLVVGSSCFSGAGRTDYTKSIEALVREYKKQFIFTGYIDNQDIYKYYQIADIQCVPSIGEEAAGLVAIEGMLSNLPLIVTDSGGLREYAPYARVVERGSMLIDNLANEILFLKNNPNLSKEISDSGYKFAKKFSRENMYDSFCDEMYK